MKIQVDILENHTINNRIEEVISYLEKAQFVFTILENSKKRIQFSIQESNKYSIQRVPGVVSAILECVYYEEEIKITNPEDENIGKKLTCHTSSLKKSVGGFSFTRAKAYIIIDEDLTGFFIRDDQRRRTHFSKSDIASDFFGEWFLLS